MSSKPQQAVFTFLKQENVSQKQIDCLKKAVAGQAKPEQIVAALEEVRNTIGFKHFSTVACLLSPYLDSNFIKTYLQNVQPDQPRLRPRK